MTFIGIDVGAPRKGLHAVALRERDFESRHFTTIDDAASWVKSMQPAAVAIDAPCSWAQDGRSRECERTLEIDGARISCFSTPTEKLAAGNPFYDWVCHGLDLYAALKPDFTLYQGCPPDGPVMCETFPQAVACHLAGNTVPTRGKASVRRQILRNCSIDPTALRNIDFIDAALCALTAEALVQGSHRAFGNPRDGIIVVPSR